MSAETAEDLRAYRFALDLTAGQLSAVRQHAGAARWAYNHALAVKFAALDARTTKISQLVEQGVDLAAARAQVPKVPGKQQIQKAHNAIKGDDRRGLDGISPWWHSVSTYAFQSAFIDADTAFGSRGNLPCGLPPAASTEGSSSSMSTAGLRPALSAGPFEPGCLNALLLGISGDGC